MGKKSRDGNRFKLPPFTPLLNEEMDSKAFSELSGSAVKVLMWFKRTDGKLRRLDALGYSGVFDFTYTEAERRGFARRTFSRAIEELGKSGFVEIVSVGGLRGAGRSNSKYKLSKRWLLYEVQPKPKGEWRRHPTEPPAAVPWSS
ncbi:hypothetical protein [Citrifermentans bremense]|uniref:Uncharacterized protein n=1 Tax=Citrifermentans bremense TaxID=60035 RepID=A0A6S6LXU4_9BACT|nr:hypothetical protein [Citrifermentans bremense]